MAYKAKFESWDKLKLVDLIVAYRKAKSDCFFDNNLCPTAIKFAAYEKNLLARLEGLLVHLKSHGFTSTDLFLGDCKLVPKKLSVKHDSWDAESNIHFSDPDRAFHNLPQNSTVTPEFRIVGDFPVETHIISALWINMIGHKFDECLDDKSCYASRLKRVSVDDEFCVKDRRKKFHIESIGSFKPYFQPYQRFRQDGITAMRDELKKEENIIAASLDLKSYYHTIDPLALKSLGLRKSLGLVGERALSKAELLFTTQLAFFLHNWSNKARVFLAMSGKALATKPMSGSVNKKYVNTFKEIGGVPGGLVIGLTASRIISNVMLHHWDRLIKEELSPIYYGRYVDDIFIVLRDPGNVCGIDALMKLLSKKLGKRHLTCNKNGAWEIQQGKAVQAESKIIFQNNKQKLFVLSGQTGLDLLDNIEEEIRELSSERRLMPSPTDLENSAAVRVLSAVSGIGERADTLRRSDGLTIQRLGLALHLKHVETLARDLPASEWSNERLDFYEFVQNHILCVTNLLNNFSYIPRILGLAVSCGEWRRAMYIIELAFQSLQELFDHASVGKTIIVNGVEVENAHSLIRETIFKLTTCHFTWVFFEAVVRHYSMPRTSNDSGAISVFMDKLRFHSNEFSPDLPLNISNALDDKSRLGDYSDLVIAADLAHQPYRKNVLTTICHPKPQSAEEADKWSTPVDNIDIGRSLRNVLEESSFGEMEALDNFLLKRNKKINIDPQVGESLLPYLFPTRPYTPAEIAEFIPECILHMDGFNSTLWSTYTKALRGVSIKSNDGSSDKTKKVFSGIASIGTQKKEVVTVALSNFKTEDLEWREMANGESKLRLERYKRIAYLVNQAIKIKPKPDYLVFPELSIPIQWIDSLAANLMAEGISLIAGTEYRHADGNKIFSEACLVLSDNRLGFPSWVKILQPKVNPAVSEEKELISKFGKAWLYSPEPSEKNKQKQVYNHNGFHFAVMICSELQNSRSRVDLQGSIDALFVLAWNPDLDTFSSLVESAALDIHAYTILVNNRKYGDSRIRSPAKESFLRDLARVRGGNNDFVVSVTLDIQSLRAFQSRSKRWPELMDEFKPVPEGYVMRPSRKSLPSTS